MHRQSLGSPASKLHSHGVLFTGDGVTKANIGNTLISDDHRKDKSASCSAVGADDEERKSQKPYQQRHVLVSSSTRLVHLIPVLTFLCFVILYLSSHDPSRKDLAQFSGFTTLSSKKNVIDSIDIDDNLNGFLEIEKTDALAIGSMRNLQQQEERHHHHHLHRKFGQ